MRILSDKFGAIPLHGVLLSGKSLKAYTYTASNQSGNYYLLNLQSGFFSAWLVEIHTGKTSDKLTFDFQVSDIALHISIMHSIVWDKELLHENSFILYYSPFAHFRMETAKETTYCFLELFIAPANLQGRKKRYTELNTFLQSIAQGVPVKYFDYPLVIDFSRLQIIERIKIASSETELNKCCQKIVTDCLNIAAQNNNKVPQHITLNEANKIYKVREFIDTHISDKDLSLEKIHEETMISLFTIKHGFKKIYHTTPHKYITVSRLKQSLQLLRTTNRIISDISETLGFEHIKTFNRLFQQFYGITPMRYRKVSKSV